MIYKYEKELKTKASEFVAYLKNNNIVSYILNESLREYNIKINVNNEDKINIYYSPAKKRYSLVLLEMQNIGMKNLIEEKWKKFTDTTTIEKISTVKTETSTNVIEIYVDGSFYQGGYGYGFVVVENNQNVYQQGGYVEDNIFREQNNVGGELVSLIKALNWCKNKNYNEVKIYHDYVGVAKFVNGMWKAKTDATILFANTIKSFNIKIIFQKVAAHSNNKWNDVVDNLAKEGALKDPLKSLLSENNLKLNQSNIAAGFSEYLAIQGVDSNIVDLNSPYAARLNMKIGRNSKIIFDIYDSKNRKISNPYITNANKAETNTIMKYYLDYLKKNNLI
ncbi:MAG: hypothetical protein V1773_17285 [bacterium]